MKLSSDDQLSMGMVKNPLFLVVVGCILFGTVVSYASLSNEPFVGTWELNPTLSHFGAEVPTPRKITISQVNGGLRVRGDSNVAHVDRTEWFDGQRHRIDKEVQIETLRLEARVIQVKTYRKDRLWATLTRTLSADGKKIKAVVETVDSSGLPIEETRVFEKVP